MLSHSYSTTSNETSQSDDSFSSQPKIRGLPDIFLPTNVLTRPLLAQKYKQCEEVSVQFDGKDYICRICHGGDSTGDLLTPCHCRGSIALAHLQCLEIWLNESNRNECELCQYHFRIVREPKYGIIWSIFVFLRHPEEHFRELLLDAITLVIYTPSTVTSTYMLMLLLESLSKLNEEYRKSVFSHVLAFTAIFGIATINFIYTSWLVLTIEKYVDYWREWYRRHCNLRVILSSHKLHQSSVNSNSRGITSD